MMDLNSTRILQRLCWVAILTCSTLGALLAQRQITGSVSDAQGSPLIGVSVFVSGEETTGTISDVDGSFSLEVSSQADSLTFSYIGFQTLTVPITPQTSYDVRMLEKSELLDEVVVIGYGTARKRDLIGAVDQVSSREIENQAVTSVDLALRGQSAGVQLRQGSGQPGSGAEILIRGIGSISAGNGPLIVVDGLPLGNGNSQTNNFLALLDPNEIESVSVIRDASGKAIYGSRASAGLILITTKRGQKGKPTISLNAYTGIQTVPPWEQPQILNATELATFLRERIIDQATVNGTTPNIPENLQNPEQYGEGTDWFDAMTRRAMMQNINLNVSGGSDNLRYSLGLGYTNQDGTIIETNLKRYSFRANVDANITDWLTFGLELNPSWTDNQSGNTDPGGGQFSVYNTVNVAQWADPTAPLYDENGNLTPTTQGELLPFFQANPVFKLKNEQVLRQNRQVLLGTNLKADILPGLYAKTYFGVRYLNNINRTFSPGSVVGESLTPFNPDPAANSSAFSGRFESIRLVSENTINFNRTIGNDHNIDAVVGYTAELQRQTSLNISGNRLIDENFFLFNSGNIQQNLPSNPEETRIFFNGSEGISEQSLISYLGRIAYNFRERYYLTATARVDGSSRFGPNNKFATFPSVGVAWRLSEEPWLPKSDLISNLRFEASYGLSGSNSIGNYTWQGTVSNGANYVLGGGNADGAFLGGIPNPNLSWEETEQFDVGVEIGFLDNRLNLEVDYYRQLTEQLLYSAPLPAITGFGSFITNLGAIENKGVEIALNMQPIVTNKAVWNLNANVSFNRNEVLQLGADDLPIRGSFAGNGTPVSWTQVGAPVGQFYGLRILGLYTPELIEDPSVPKYPGAVVGAPYYVDGDGDGQLESFQDYVFIGNPFPDFTFGITNLVTYGDFELRVIASGEVGSKILDLQREFMLNTDGVFNVRDEVKDRWRPGSDDFTVRPPTTTSVTSSQRYRWPNSLGVIDGTFLKIDNVTLTYNLGKLLQNQNVLRGGSVYVSVQNALVFSEFQGNPEIRRAATGNLERNINYGSYPVPRTFTLGFNLKM